MNLIKKMFTNLLVILSTSLLMLSCGKQIEGKGKSSGNVVITPELNPNVLLSMDLRGNASGQYSSFLFERNARIMIPQAVYVKTQGPVHYNVNLVFNTSQSPESRDAISEFYCQYKNTKFSKAYEQEFLGCFQDIDNDGIVENLGYKVGQKVFQDKWNYVRTELTSGYSEQPSEIITDLEIEWF